MYNSNDFYSLLTCNLEYVEMQEGNEWINALQGMIDVWSYVGKKLLEEKLKSDVGF